MAEALMKRMRIELAAGMEQVMTEKMVKFKNDMMLETAKNVISETAVKTAEPPSHQALNGPTMPESRPLDVMAGIGRVGRWLVEASDELHKSGIQEKSDLLLLLERKSMLMGDQAIRLSTMIATSAFS